jgi:hypothetical protein
VRIGQRQGSLQRHGKVKIHLRLKLPVQYMPYAMRRSQPEHKPNIQSQLILVYDARYPKWPRRSVLTPVSWYTCMPLILTLAHTQTITGCQRKAGVSSLTNFSPPLSFPALPSSAVVLFLSLRKRSAIRCPGVMLPLR